MRYLSCVAMNTRAFLRSLSIVAVSTALLGCNGGGSGGSGSGPRWPGASKVSAQELPAGASWNGVWFINTPGVRGTMHVLLSGDDKFYGCWIAEDKHSRATFVGTFKENVAKFDWTEKRVGFAGPPTRLAAYLVMSGDGEGRHKVKGEYGDGLDDDRGSPWEGLKQKNAEAKADGCNLEEGDTLPTEAKPLN
jgi:hypothetical protein